MNHRATDPFLHAAARFCRATAASLAMAGALTGPAIEASAQPTTLPEGFAANQVAGGLAAPTAMAFAPDGRLFVAEQGGRLRVVKNGALLATPFVTLSVSASGERGLLGIAFDPAFASNGFLYLYYTATSPTVHNRVSRFRAAGDVSDGTETVLLDLDDLSSATNHNGGAMHFGSDGTLYVAVGDNATGSNAQTLSNLLGKILRLNADGSIPSDNPFVGSTTGRNRAIWALGLRNPFTFAFQAETGRMFINDVGQSTWEEIDAGQRGANYGWPQSEGPTSTPGHTGPVYWYGHGSGPFSGCAITGGAFYPQGGPFPAGYHGQYFFADYCSGWINRIDPAAPSIATSFAAGLQAPVDLAIGPDGALWYLARGGGSNTGTVGRIEHAAAAPQITQQPAAANVAVGQSASFTVGASGSLPRTYQWQRNRIDIPGATSTTYTTPPVSAADNGALFRCVVGNAYGSATSSEALLTVGANSPPTGTITEPAAGTLYRAGDIINYAASATDPEDGQLLGSRFTWQVDLHHDGHTHPVVQPFSGSASGSFTIPTVGETSANVFHRITLTVTDSAGATHTSVRDVLPRTSTVTLTSSPAGLQRTLDGAPVTAPYSFVGVEGMIRVLGAPTQTVNGSTYVFRSWSDGGSATHDIVTPTADTNYRAAFRKQRTR